NASAGNLHPSQSVGCGRTYCKMAMSMGANYQPLIPLRQPFGQLISGYCKFALVFEKRPTCL
ncbi:MAG: hypothetical protein SV375_02785, partial [Thermodesulfobacteriota bacterium]|nr:hypothetical protein [Thermodesulfobacteriota bacterium]